MNNCEKDYRKNMRFGRNNKPKFFLCRLQFHFTACRKVPEAFGCHIVTSGKRHKHDLLELPWRIDKLVEAASVLLGVEHGLDSGWWAVAAYLILFTSGHILAFAV